MNRKILVTVQLFLLTLLVGVLAATAPAGASTEEWGSQTGQTGQSQPQPQQPTGGGRAEPLAPVGNGFSYQGQLEDGGVPADGLYDFVFKVYSSSVGGVQVGTTYTGTGRPVTDGLFTTFVDPGTGVFNGEARYLEIAVRPFGGGGFTTLTPRQALTAAPYAVGLVPGAVIAGTVANNEILILRNTSPTGGGLAIETNGGFGQYTFNTGGPSADFYGNDSQFAVNVYNASPDSNSIALNGYTYAGTGLLGQGGQYGVKGEGYGSGIGVYGTGVDIGVKGEAGDIGVQGISSTPSGKGGHFINTLGGALLAETPGNYAVEGITTGATGVSIVGTANSGTGGWFTSDTGVALVAESDTDMAVLAHSYASMAAEFESISGPLAIGVTANQGTGINIVGVTGGLVANASGTDSTAIIGTANNGTDSEGVVGNSNTGTGVVGNGGAHGGEFFGAIGSFSDGVDYGVVGNSDSGTGGWFTSDDGTAVRAYSATDLAVWATSNSSIAVVGNSDTDSAAQFQSISGEYVVEVTAFEGTGINIVGVTGGLIANASGTDSTAIIGTANNGLLAKAVEGNSTQGTGGHFTTESGDAVAGISTSGNGGRFDSDTGHALIGISNYGNGGYFQSVLGTALYATSFTGLAGEFNGQVQVTGDLTVTGYIHKLGGGFVIDHPLDPANKYLNHSFVESPDMMNVYNGNVTTNAKGEAVVLLPDYFEAVNKEYRYQLTVMGQFAQAIISSKIKNNRFTIKTDKPNVEVSWQVTGIRKDVYAEQNRIQVEVEKSQQDKGKYLHPKEWGKPESLGINYEHGR
jgi:hypothetical protein